MEGWMECRGGGCREVGAGGSLGGSQGRPGGEVEGLEAEREAGLDESSDGKKQAKSYEISSRQSIDVVEKKGERQGSLERRTVPLYRCMMLRSELSPPSPAS